MSCNNKEETKMKKIISLAPRTNIFYLNYLDLKLTPPPYSDNQLQNN